MKNLRNGKHGHIEIKNKEHFLQLIGIMEKKTNLEFIGVQASELPLKCFELKKTWKEIKNILKNKPLYLAWTGTYNSCHISTSVHHTFRLGKKHWAYSHEYTLNQFGTNIKKVTY